MERRLEFSEFLISPFAPQPQGIEAVLRRRRLYAAIIISLMLASVLAIVDQLANFLRH